MKNRFRVLSVLSILLLVQSSSVKATDWVSVGLGTLGLAGTALCVADLSKNSNKKSGVEFSLQSCGALASLFCSSILLTHGITAPTTNTSKNLLGLTYIALSSFFCLTDY